MQTSTLRPGLLVSLKTSMRGNVNYIRRDLDIGKKQKDGSLQTRWETERTIADPKEHKRASEARSKATWPIRKVCTASAFGLLCPEKNATLLAEAIEEARQICKDFNDSAKLSRVSVYVLTARVAENDREAIRGINSEIRDLMRDMTEGLKNLDATAVRAAASKAKNMGQMLSDDASKRVQLAVDAARSAAKQIVKAGEQVSMEIDQAAIRTIKRQASAFLDLDDAKEIGKPVRNAEAVDLVSTTSVKPTKAQRSAELDME
jgi:hypothetical protein